jgi:hypothetical protein
MSSSTPRSRSDNIASGPPVTGETRLATTCGSSAEPPLATRTHFPAVADVQGSELGVEPAPVTLSAPGNCYGRTMRSCLRELMPSLVKTLRR